MLYIRRNITLKTKYREQIVGTIPIIETVYSITIK